jgi:hypothetical protein
MYLVRFLIQKKALKHESFVSNSFQKLYSLNSARKPWQSNKTCSKSNVFNPIFTPYRNIGNRTVSNSDQSFLILPNRI